MSRQSSKYKGYMDRNRHIPIIGKPEIPDGPQHAIKLNAMGPPPYKVHIAIPSRGEVPIHTVSDLVSLVGFTTITLVADHVISLALDVVTGTIVHPARNALVGKALRGNASHILFIDDDMRFPEDALLRLMNHNKPIVGTNYSCRKFPPRPIAMAKVGAQGRGEAELLWTEPDDDGLVEVEGIGFGMVLVQTDVFIKLGWETFPWFDYRYDKEARLWVGEDIHFCQLARKAGYQIWVDQKLSNDMKHIGTFEFSLEQSVEFKEEFLNESRHLRELAAERGRLAEQIGPDFADRRLHLADRVEDEEGSFNPAPDSPAAGTECGEGESPVGLQDAEDPLL